VLPRDPITRNQYLHGKNLDTLNISLSKKKVSLFVTLPILEVILFLELPKNVGVKINQSIMLTSAVMMEIIASVMVMLSMVPNILALINLIILNK